MTDLLADIAAAVDTAVTAEQAALEALEAAVTFSGEPKKTPVGLLS